ncbi:MAG: flavodoxin family protein [Syntrophomonadaceae bacterium]|nr:flavodoxin family protein [Syntrophomonadaceae bacterium]
MERTLIVAVNGSPNPRGNTAALLEAALQACRAEGADTAVIHCQQALRGQRQKFCVACESPCTGKCGQGTRLGEAHALMARADGLLLGSPVYFGTVSAQLKAFWDKTRHLRTARALLNVPGGALAVGASRFGGQETTLRALQDMMLVQGMLVVGDGEREHDCGHLGAAAQRPATADEEGLQRAALLGRRLVEVARVTRSIRVRT